MRHQTNQATDPPASEHSAPPQPQTGPQSGATAADVRIHHMSQGRATMGHLSPRNNHSGNEMQKKQIRIAMANRMMMFTIVGMVLLLMGMLLVAVMFLMLLQDGGGGGGGGDGVLHEGH